MVSLYPPESADCSLDCAVPSFLNPKSNRLPDDLENVAATYGAQQIQSDSNRILLETTGSSKSD
jgi:hypothetical protein